MLPPQSDHQSECLLHSLFLGCVSRGLLRFSHEDIIDFDIGAHMPRSVSCVSTHDIIHIRAETDNQRPQEQGTELPRRIESQASQVRAANGIRRRPSDRDINEKIITTTRITAVGSINFFAVTVRWFSHWRPRAASGGKLHASIRLSNQAPQTLLAGRISETIVKRHYFERRPTRQSDRIVSRKLVSVPTFHGPDNAWRPSLNSLRIWLTGSQGISTL